MPAPADRKDKDWTTPIARGEIAARAARIVAATDPETLVQSDRLEHDARILARADVPALLARIERDEKLLRRVVALMREAMQYRGTPMSRPDAEDLHRDLRVAGFAPEGE